MLLQNTVDPWSNLIRDKSRVAGLMGNRGVVHDHMREVKARTWSNQRWICCAKEFKGIDRRPLFKTDPFSYSELFFLDEATAYAAGHRPCNDCRKDALVTFKRIWQSTFGNGDHSKIVTVKDIDERLHSERIDKTGRKATFSAPLASLPPGAMFTLDGNAFLIQCDGVRLWTSSGYQHVSTPSLANVDVLTPPSIVQMIQNGLPVQVHESARRFSTENKQHQ